VTAHRLQSDRDDTGTGHATPGDARRRRRARAAGAVGLAWLGGVAAWYYVGTLLALWTSITR